MSKKDDILGKKASNKLRKIAFGATLGASALFMGSCSSENKENKDDNKERFEKFVELAREDIKNGVYVIRTDPEYYKARDFVIFQQEQEKKQEVVAKIKQIEAAGIPTVKKDKDGNVVEILSEIDESLSYHVDKDSVVKDYTYKNPKYMKAHREAYSEKEYIHNGEKNKGITERSLREIRHPEREYDTTPTSLIGGDIEGVKTYHFDISTGAPTKRIEENGDTVIITHTKEFDDIGYDKVHLKFKYKLKEQTKVKNNIKAQQMARRGSRNS
jgi:hypothetical protein